MASPPKGTSSEKPPAQKDPSPTADEVEPGPDSLFFLGDDAIQVVIKFVSPADLSKFEVCTRLRGLITPRWDVLLADAEKRTGASRPVPPVGTSSDPKAYSSKLSLMYLLRSVDRAVDVEERTRAGEVFETNRDKHYAAWRDFNHIFVRISHRAGSSDGGSFHVAWQGFVSAKWAERGFRGQWGIKLTLPEEASLYELHPHAKALKEDFNALKRKDISFSEWRQREKTASAEISDKAVISVIATRLDQGPENFGTIVSEMVTSSRIDGRIGILPTNRPPCLVIFMASTREETKRYDISLHCDENSISLSSAFLE